jgi:hypothetical protein
MIAKSVKRIAALIIAIPLLSIVIAGVGIFLILFLPPVQHKVLQEVVKRVNPAIAGELSIGHISTNLFSILELDDVQIRDPFDDTDELSIKNMRIRWQLPHLLRKEIRLSSVMIDGIRIRCSIDEQGVFKFPALPTPGNQTEKKPIAIKADAPIWRVSGGPVHLRNIHAEFYDRANNQFGRIEEGSIQARIVSLDSIIAQLTVSQGSYRSPWWTGSELSISSSVTITPQCLNVENLKITDSQTTFSGSGRIPFTESGKWDVGATVSSEIKAIPAVFNNVPGFGTSGNVQLTASWRGSMAQPLLKAELYAYSIEIGENTIDSLHVAAQYDSGSLLTSDIFLGGRGGSCKVSASVKIPDLFSRPLVGDYSLQTNLDDITPRKIREVDTLLPEVLRKVAFSAAISANGSGITALPARLICTGGIKLPDLSKQLVDFTASLQDSTVSVSIDLEGNTLSGTGTLGEGGAISGLFNLSAGNCGGITTRLIGTPVTGTILSRISCGGTLQSPVLQAVIRGSQLSWRSVFADTMITEIRMLPENQFYLDTFALAGSAVLDSLADSSYHIPVKGNAGFTVSGGGPLLHPDLFFTTFGNNLQYEKVNADSFRIEVFTDSLDSITLSSAYTHLPDIATSLSITGGYSLSSHQATLSAGCTARTGDSVQLAGNLRGNGKWREDTVIAEVVISDFPIALFGQLASLEKELNGTLTASCNVSGSVSNPLIKLSLNAINPKYDRFLMEHIAITAKMKDSLIYAGTTVLFTPVDSLTLKGMLPVLPSFSYRPDTSGERPCSVSVFGEDLPVQLFRPLLDTVWQTGGTVSVDVAAHLHEKELVVDGGVKIRDGAVHNGVYQLSASGISVSADLSGPISEPAATFEITASPVVVSGEKIDTLRCIGSVNKDNLRLTSGDLIVRKSGYVSLTGNLPFAAGAEAEQKTNSHIDFSIVQIPLQVAAPFISGATVQQGTIQGKGSVRFPQSGPPEVTGTITLSDGGVTLEEIGPPIGPVSVEIDFAGDSVFLRKLDAAWGKGTCSGTGTMVLRSDSLPSITGSLRILKVGCSMPEVFDAAVEKADLKLSTNENRYLVTGNVLAGECRYTQDIQINDLLSRFRTVPYTPPPTATDSLLRNIKLNIGVDLQDNVSLDMNLGYLKIGGNMQLTGSVAKPSYTGELRLTEGYVYYLDRKFTIEKAVLTNYNPGALNPGISIEAVSQVTAVSGGQMEYYTILLKVTGSLDNPVVTLSEKTGALNQIEIVSILTFGQLTGGMSGDVRERLRTFVGQSVLGFGTRKLEKALGIEKIEFQGDVFGGKNGVASSRVTIAKRLSPRLTVLYETEIGALEKPKISALFRIVKNVFISGERSSDGNAGIDLIFKYSR